MSSLDEVVLRDAFRELRTIERAAVPRFQWRAAALRDTGQPRAAVLHWSGAAMLTLIVILTFGILLRPATPPVTTLTNWKAPTDFLLQTPQADLLRNVPQFGERNSTQ